MKYAIAASCIVMFAISGAASSMQSVGTGTHAHADGQTSVSVHVDAGAAAVVRAWRRAHGLEAPADAAPQTADTPNALQQWREACHDNGGKPVQQSPSDAGDRTPVEQHLCT